MGAQYVGKGIHNTLTKGKSWGDDWQTSLWQGAAKGFVGGGMGAFNKAAGGQWLRDHGFTASGVAQTGAVALAGGGGFGAMYGTLNAMHQPDDKPSSPVSPQRLPERPEPQFSMQFVRPA